MIAINIDQRIVEVLGYQQQFSLLIYWQVGRQSVT